MFDAKLQQGVLFKKIVDSIKDLVKSVNIDANQNGLSMQAMDSAHVALVSLKLNESGFKDYRCDRPLTLGLSIENLSKILKCAGNDDSITLQTDEEEPSSLKFFFENSCKYKSQTFFQFSNKIHFPLKQLTRLSESNNIVIKHEHNNS